MSIYGLDSRKVVICMRRNKLIKEEIQSMFEYCDGELWRKAYIDKQQKNLPKRLVKLKANSQGYCQVWFKDRMVMYHALIWVLVNGEIPENMQIDHIDGDKLNNRPDNLRLVSNRQNSQNRALHREGRLPGCYFYKPLQKWRANVRVNGKTYHIGYYITELEAHNAYVKFLEENGLSRLANGF